MKFVIIFTIALFAAVSSAPTQITDNNVGDIITVGINANLNLSNQVDMNLINVIVGLINQQAAVGSLDGDAPVPVPAASSPKAISPKLLESITKMLSKSVKVPSA
ncbi:unnamed protein product [Diamesa serratosioi]